MGVFLLVDVDEAQASGVDGVGVLEAEAERLVLGLDVLGLDAQHAEDGHGQGLRARAEEVLVEGVEGEGAGGAGQEGERRRHVALDGAVEAVLLTLLADDGGEEGYELSVAVADQGVSGRPGGCRGRRR